MSSIAVNQLTKRFGKFEVFHQVNCHFDDGKIYGLFGNNGAGKTTLLNIITNRLFPTEGSVKIDGENAVENDRALSKIYLMSEKTMNREENKFKRLLQMTKEFYPELNREYAYALAERFGLDQKKKYQNLSTGYRSIVKIVLALSSQAPILIFDEPILGLDASHRDLFYKELLKRYEEYHPTVIISTHIIEEVADLVEEVVILDQGRILEQRNVSDLMDDYYVVSGKAEDVDAYMADKEPIHTEMVTGFKSVTVKGKPDGSAQGVDFSKASLQQLFIHLTNGGK